MHRCVLAALGLTAVLSALLRPACAAVVAAVLLPHGDMALDPAREVLNDTQRQQAAELQAAGLSAGRWLAATRPDLVLLTTPHGIADMSSYSFYLNPSAAGCLEPAPAQAGCSSSGNGPSPTPTPNVCANASIDVAASVGLIKYLQDRTFSRTTGLSGFGPPGQAGAPFPLGWGEVIPLAFLPAGLRQIARFMVLSFPTRRYNESTQMVPELLSLGGAVFDALDALPQRVAVIVSGDLAHTHDKDGPYGWSADAAPFDAAITHWVQTLQPEQLLVEARRHQPGAKSCGFTGLVLLHGMLQRGSVDVLDVQAGKEREARMHELAGGQRTLQQQEHQGQQQLLDLHSNWSSQLLAASHPTYYGMAVATFARLS